MAFEQEQVSAGKNGGQVGPTCVVALPRRTRLAYEPVEPNGGAHVVPGMCQTETILGDTAARMMGRGGLRVACAGRARSSIPRIPLADRGHIGSRCAAGTA